MEIYFLHGLYGDYIPLFPTKNQQVKVLSSCEQVPLLRPQPGSRAIFLAMQGFTSYECSTTGFKTPRAILG